MSERSGKQQEGGPGGVCLWTPSSWSLSHQGPWGWHVRPPLLPLLHELYPPEGAAAQEEETGPRGRR